MVEHMGAVKQLLCYIGGTIDYILSYPRGSGEAKLVGYSDSNHVGGINMRKSTSGALLFLGGSLISWQSAEQRFVAASSCKADYVSVSRFYELITRIGMVKISAR